MRKAPIIGRITEDLIRVEENCLFTSFLFSKIYDLEPHLTKTSKYAMISRHAVFMTLQRSKTCINDIIRNCEMLGKNKMSREIENRIRIMKIETEGIEKAYKEGNFKGILQRFEEIAEESSAIRDKISKKVYKD